MFSCKFGSVVHCLVWTANDPMFAASASLLSESSRTTAVGPRASVVVFFDLAEYIIDLTFLGHRQHFKYLMMRMVLINIIIDDSIINNDTMVGWVDMSVNVLHAEMLANLVDSIFRLRMTLDFTDNVSKNCGLNRRDVVKISFMIRCAASTVIEVWISIICSHSVALSVLKSLNLTCVGGLGAVLYLDINTGAPRYLLCGVITSHTGSTVICPKLCKVIACACAVEYCFWVSPTGLSGCSGHSISMVVLSFA